MMRPESLNNSRYVRIVGGKDRFNFKKKLGCYGKDIIYWVFDRRLGRDVILKIPYNLNGLGIIRHEMISIGKFYYRNVTQHIYIKTKEPKWKRYFSITVIIK